MRLLTDLTPGNGRYDTHLDLQPDVFAALDGQLSDQGRRTRPAGTAGVSLPDQDDGSARSAPAGRSRPGGAHDALRLGAELEAPLRDGASALQLTSFAEFFSSRIGPRSRMLLVGSWAVSFVLMAATSTEVGGLFAEGQGHEIAQGYGSFLWAGVVLYAMVAWRVWARRSEFAIAGTPSPSPARPFPGLISTRRRCRGRSSRPEYRKLIGFLT